MSTVRRRIAAVATLLLVPVLAACGFNEQTDAVYQASTGTNARNGDIWILNATVVSKKDGKGTFAGTFVNQTEDTSVSLVSVTGADTAKTPAITIGPSQHVNLGQSGDIRLTGTDLVPGRFVSLTFAFDSGQTTTFKVPVVSNTGDYADVPVGKVSKKGTDGAKASSTPSGSPSSSASAG